MQTKHDFITNNEDPDDMDINEDQGFSATDPDWDDEEDMSEDETMPLPSEDTEDDIDEQDDDAKIDKV